MSTVKRKNILELSFVLRGRKVKVSSDILVKVCIAFANGIFFIFYFFMETGLCNCKSHKKIVTYIRELILILDPVQRQDKTLHNSYVCMYINNDMHKHRQ